MPPDQPGLDGFEKRLDGDVIIAIFLASHQRFEPVLTQDLLVLVSAVSAAMIGVIDAAFSGPLLRDVIAPLAFSESDTLVLTAINEYKVEIPVSDAIKYDVIVALEKDGAPMSIRENGPLWVIYPMSEHPELQEAIYTSRLIWQLIGIDVK